MDVRMPVMDDLQATRVTWFYLHLSGNTLALQLSYCEDLLLILSLPSWFVEHESEEIQIVFVVYISVFYKEEGNL